jgi:hypothetical protein
VKIAIVFEYIAVAEAISYLYVLTSNDGGLAKTNDNLLMLLAIVALLF